MTDADLLQRWIDDASHEAFDALVRRHVDMVHAVALRRVGDADLAQDVAQATFLVLARKARSVRRRASVAAWLHQVTRHAATDALRRRQVRAKREREAAMHADAEQRPADDPWLDIREHLEPALDRLPRRDREAILLRFYEQQTFEQIAAVQGVNVGTAHRRVHKALEKLAAGLRHRGVAVPAAALGTALGAHATAAAPAGVAAGATSLALATGSLTGAIAGAGSLGIAKGAMTMMTLAKLKVAAVLTVAAAVLTGAGTVAVQQTTSSAIVAASVAQPHSTGPVPADRSMDSDEARVVALRFIVSLMIQNDSEAALEHVAPAAERKNNGAGSLRRALRSGPERPLPFVLERIIFFDAGELDAVSREYPDDMWDRLRGRIADGVGAIAVLRLRGEELDEAQRAQMDDVGLIAVVLKQVNAQPQVVYFDDN